MIAVLTSFLPFQGPEVAALPIKEVDNNGEPALEIPRIAESSTDFTPRQEEEEEAKEAEVVAVQQPVKTAFETPAMSVEEKMDMYKEAADDLLDDLGEISSDDDEEKVEMFRPAETQEVPVVPLKKGGEVESKEDAKEEKKRKVAASFSETPQALAPLPAALERNIKIVKKVRWGWLMMHVVTRMQTLAILRVCTLLHIHIRTHIA